MTPRQKDMLDAIRDLTVDGVSPTYEQLRIKLGIASKSGVCRMVDALERQGYVRRVAFARQTLEVVAAPRLHGNDLAARLRGLTDEAFAGVLEVISEEIARRAGGAA